ncbi:MAG: YCF48-related protein, partial [Ignavibacteria bacterium]|nr:YCF48-related protein [Ignavibacteria bacterium]
MKNKILIVLILVLAVYSDTYAQWAIYQTNTSMNFYKIQFVNENTGFVAGGESSEGAGFFKTTDAGVSWQRYTMSDTISWNWSTIYGMHFLNENTGYVSGRYLRIFKTTNGGLNWQSFIPPYYSITQIYNALYFMDENTGYAAGRYGYVCKTTNGGLNWELKADLEGNLYGAYFINQNTGFFSTDAGGVYKTTNGGQDFSFSYLGDFGFESVRFINDTLGFICGRNVYFHSGVYKTTNCGLTWESSLICNYTLYDVFFTNRNSGYLSGQNVILKTTTSGVNWNPINNPDNNGYLNMFFVTSNHGFLSGGNGKIYKTTSGGVWINQISTEVPVGFKISNCYPNPFNSELKVQIELNTRLIKNSDLTLEIYNTLGEIIIDKRIYLQYSGVYEIGIRFDEYPSGIYYVRLRSKNTTSYS